MLTPETLRSAALAVREAARPIAEGRLLRVSGAVLEAYLPSARMGDAVEVLRPEGSTAGEVVGFRDGFVLIVPFSDVRGLMPGAAVRRVGSAAAIAVPPEILGRVVDAFGRPIDGGPPFRSTRESELVPLERSSPPMGERAPIHRRFETGVRAIDGFLTNWITLRALNCACTAARSCAQRRPHSKAAWLFSTCTAFSSIARISAAWLSGMRPCCQA